MSKQKQRDEGKFKKITQNGVDVGTVYTPTNKDNRGGLREKLAAIEHERWADWQLWCHEIIRTQAGVIPSVEAVLKRWDKQCATPYKDLTDAEKDSDREQVDRYLPLIQQLIAECIPEKRENVPDGFEPTNIAGRLDDFNRGFNDCHDTITKALQAKGLL